MRTNFWSMGLLGALGVALAGGCTHTRAEADTTPHAETVNTAQSQSQQAMKRALDAQKRASDMESDAQKAQADVMQKQRDLASAQAAAATARQRAQDAQQLATQQRNDANQAASAAQSDALKAQHSEAQASRKQLQSVEGQMTSVQGDKVFIYRGDETPLQLMVDSNTQITLDGRQASLSDLPQGADVHASYAPGVGFPHATKIEATSPSAPEDAPRTYPSSHGGP